MEDLLGYDITQAIGGNPWTFTQTNCTDTIVGPTGVLSLTLGGANNDLGQMQLAESPFQTNGRKLFFECRFKLTLAASGTIAANELAIGLFSEQTGTNFMAADGLSLAADDALGLVKFDAQASCDCVMRENDVQSVSSAVLTLTDDTWVTFSIYYDGTQAKFYKDGGEIATLTTVDATSVLNPTVYIKAGEAIANVLNVDYILVAAERVYP